MGDVSGKVYRINEPYHLQGIVISFDHERGYGFISSGGINYFLHLSEVVPTWVPLPGNKVDFYVAETKEGQRACFVKPVD